MGICVPRVFRSLGLWSCLLIALSWQSAAQAAAAGKTTPAASSAGYVGSDTCKTCHEDVYKAMQLTPHQRMGDLPDAKSKGVQCESCHGPGSEHVAGGGDVSKIRTFKNASVSDVSQICLGCHESGLEIRHGSQSPHTKNNVGCLSCHSPHHAEEKVKLLVKPQPQLCYQCHAIQRAEFSRPFRHRVNEGLVQCSDCHNPHGTALPKAVRVSIGDQQVCFKCHTEFQGPFSFEHVPVKTEGCLSCHLPHGSTNPRMLRVSQVNLLCLQCHTLTMNNNVPEAPSFHNQAQKYQACTMCHVRIHGSNFNEFFFK